MAWKRLVFRAIGGLVVLSMSWRAYAEHIWGPPSTTKVPSTTKDWQESTPATSEWRPKGFERDRGTPSNVFRPGICRSPWRLRIQGSWASPWSG